MNNLEISQLLERAQKINEESQGFVEQCKITIQASRHLRNDTSWLIEESMVLKEEVIADRCKSLAIYKLANSSKKFRDGEDMHALSINEDTAIALQMIEDLKQTRISMTSPLHNLRSRLLALSYLP
jgi:hypothetical protein